MKDTDADYPAWLMLSQVLGGDTGSRLWFRLREHEGLSYGVSTWAFADAFDEAGGFGGYAIVAPQNLAQGQGLAARRDRQDRERQGRRTRSSQRAKDAWIKDQDTSLSDDNYVVQHARRTSCTAAARPTSRSSCAPRSRRVTGADIERVAKKWFDPKRLVFVDAGDHAKEK